MKLPKEHLSFSQIVMWLNGKEGYRKRYYPKISPAPISSIYMDFGNEVTEAMERGEDWVAFIPRFRTFEYELLVDVGEGVKVKAFIDNLDEVTVEFIEQKTVMNAWSENKVKKHIQLDIYSLLLQIHFGKVKDECSLICVETEKKFKTVMMGDIELTGGEMKMGLTGNYKVTKRIITQDERDACRELIIRVAREIEEDYAALGRLY